jgi:hypothetical protein
VADEANSARRKIRCNGEQPACNVCAERGWECEYEEEDRRKWVMKPRGCLSVTWWIDIPDVTN